MLIHFTLRILSIILYHMFGVIQDQEVCFKHTCFWKVLIVLKRLSEEMCKYWIVDFVWHLIVEDGADRESWNVGS
jgi:hypothetical protein